MKEVIQLIKFAIIKMVSIGIFIIGPFVSLMYYGEQYPHLEYVLTLYYYMILVLSMTILYFSLTKGFHDVYLYKLQSNPPMDEVIKHQRTIADLLMRTEPRRYLIGQLIMLFIEILMAIYHGHYTKISILIMLIAIVSIIVNELRFNFMKKNFSTLKNRFEYLNALSKVAKPKGDENDDI